MEETKLVVAPVYQQAGDIADQAEQLPSFACGRFDLHALLCNQKVFDDFADGLLRLAVFRAVFVEVQRELFQHGLGLVFVQTVVLIRAAAFL